MERKAENTHKHNKTMFEMEKKNAWKCRGRCFNFLSSAPPSGGCGRSSSTHNKLHHQHQQQYNNNNNNNNNDDDYEDDDYDIKMKKNDDWFFMSRRDTRNRAVTTKFLFGQNSTFDVFRGRYDFVTQADACDWKRRWTGAGNWAHDARHQWSSPVRV